jgi:hypothetical protein
VTSDQNSRYQVDAPISTIGVRVPSVLRDFALIEAQPEMIRNAIVQVVEQTRR